MTIEKWKDYHNQDVVEGMLNDECKDRGFFHYVLFAGVQSKGYIFWRGGYTNRERFLEECHRYMDFTTRFVDERTDRIIARLKEIL